MTEKKRLGDLLMDAGIVTKSDLGKALRLQVGGNRRLGYILVKMGFITEEQLHSVLSQQLDLPIVSIKDEFKKEVQKILPRYLCRKYSVIPLTAKENNTLKMAMVDPSDSQAVFDIEQYTGKIIRPVLASKSDITSSIKQNIPWSYKDVINSQTSSKATAIIAGIAFILVIITSVQFYMDRMQQKYGKVTQAEDAITYENHELIVGFSNEDEVSLLGRGAYASGYYSVTFPSTTVLQSFLDSKKDDFSSRQLDWLTWAMANPHANN
jgi:hypothetical protein